MKSILFNVLTIVLLLMTLSACQERPKPRNDSTTPHQIDATAAKNHIDAYEAYIDQVIDTLSSDEGGEWANPGKRLIYGASVDIEELREILFVSDKQGDLAKKDSLFIMMGIMDSDSTELIFALKSGVEPSWKFFDFTLPCPNACPKFAEE
ncbi:MAG: hypothetical protein AAF990_18510 [Bacteroidota bacterium]